MKSTKFINNISDKLKKEIPRLKPGEVRIFQMLNGMPNPEPDERERSKSPILYGKRQVQTSFRIYDPYQQDEQGKEVGGYVDMGLVEQWNGEQPLRFRLLVPGMGEYTQFQGKFQVMGGRIQDEELWEILWLSNEREGNPHRDTTVEPLFKLLDAKTDSKESVTKVDRLLEAIGIAKSMSFEESAGVMASLNQQTWQDPDIMKAKVVEFAKNNVEAFLTAAKNKDNKLHYTIRMAIESGKLNHDIVTGDVQLGTATLTNIRVTNINDFVPQFVQWLKTSDNGKGVLENIEATAVAVK